MKKILRFIFVIFIIASIILTAIGIWNKEWETVTASISLIIAIISGWIAYEVFIKHAEAEKPQSVLRVDFRSRFGLILLLAENLGTRPAFNIKFIWEKELKNHKGEIVKFNHFDKEFDIPVLNAKEQTSIIVDTPWNFFEKYKNDDLDYSGTILFQEALSLKRKTEYPFKFSFKHYSTSPSFDNEEPKTMHELQKIPGQLNEIKRAIEKINVDNISPKP